MAKKEQRKTNRDHLREAMEAEPIERFDLETSLKKVAKAPKKPVSKTTIYLEEAMLRRLRRQHGKRIAEHETGKPPTLNAVMVELLEKGLRDSEASRDLERR